MSPQSKSRSLGRRVLLPALIGLAVMLLFFGGLAAWSVFAPLSGATIAVGKVTPQGSTRVVQHKEGGIVESIGVMDGTRVRAGQPLVRLRDTQARSELQKLEVRYYTIRIREDRLKAERNGRDDWVANPYRSDDPYLLEAARVQTELFISNRRSQRDEVSIREKRIDRLSAVIEGYRAQNAAVRIQKDLIAKEISGVRPLFEKGLARLPRLLALQREQARLDQHAASIDGMIARTGEEIAGLELEIAAVRSYYLQNAADQLAQLTEPKHEAIQGLVAIRDVLERLVIRAPVDGTIFNLRIRTIGGVLQPGETVLNIVPANEKLIVEARIQPPDIDSVDTGQAAMIELSAYAGQQLDRLDGRVVTVSADLLMDERSMEPYYEALIEVAADDLGALPPEVQLTPGMPVETYIATEPRTLLEYLTDPVASIMHKAVYQP